MATHYLWITFYGRETALQVPIGQADYEVLFEDLKALAAGSTDLKALYLFTISDKLSVLIALREVQTVRFAAKSGSEPSLAGGVAFYLRGRNAPLVFDYTGKGPLDDMFHGLATTQYDEVVPGCVMLTDGSGEPAFLRLDEIQYAIVHTELIQRPS
ncbi:MAG TPA: hypothetical protein VFK12_09665 [Gammaproteobacteria bacterium]|nr:hypothetical protein [Gammaproteobacteria bacterium]